MVSHIRCSLTMSSASAAGSAAKDRAARRMSGPGSVAHAQFVRHGAVCAGGAAVEAGRETHRKWRVRTPATLACHKPLIDRKSVWCLIPVQFVYEIGIGCVRLSQRFRVVLCFSGGDGIPVSLISLSRDGPTRSQQSERDAYVEKHFHHGIPPLLTNSSSFVAPIVITSCGCSFGLSIARFILDALKAPTNSSARGKGCLTFSTNSLSVIGYGPEQLHAPGRTATTNRREKSRERVSQNALLRVERVEFADSSENAGIPEMVNAQQYPLNNT